MNRVLRSGRLTLRAPQPGDEHAAFAGWAQDPEVLRYLGWRPHTELAQTRTQLDWDQARWLKRSAYTWLLLADDLATEGTPAVPGRRPIGMVQLTPQQLGEPPFHLRLGYLLARPHWGRGLMRQAVALVLAEAFAQASVWRVDALCDVGNPASVRLLQSLGFAQEGVLRRFSVHPNLGAEPRDVSVHARVRLPDAGGG